MIIKELIPGRISCLYCVRKHIAQASILNDESRLGYPHHKYFSAGHLAEAESECLTIFPEFAKKIREVRIAIMSNKTTIITFDELIMEACVLNNDINEINLSKINSKEISFDFADVIKRNKESLLKLYGNDVVFEMVNSIDKDLACEFKL